MSLDPNKTYLVWNGTKFPDSTPATFKAPAGSTIDWGDGTVETFDTASTTVNTHTYTDGKTEHTIAISGLTSISDFAFWYCGRLMSVTIGNSVTSIGNGAFRDCSSLTSITIPNSVTGIGNGAFAQCIVLTSVTIGNSVTTIGNGAFQFDTSLTSIIIPDSVTSIGTTAFADCSRLKTIISFPETPPTLGSDAIPANVQSIYVQQSSKAAYKAATNWTAFASKIVSDNIYLSFVRFNQKNKEFIREKVDSKLTAPTTPTADSVVTMAANGTVGTKPLSEFGGKLYLHKVPFKKSDNAITVFMTFYSSSDQSTSDAKLIDITHQSLLFEGENNMGMPIIGKFSPSSEDNFDFCDFYGLNLVTGETVEASSAKFIKQNEIITEM